MSKTRAPATADEPAGGLHFAPVYRDTVMRPAFAHARLDHMRRVDKAHAVMLAETGLLPRIDVATILREMDRLDSALEQEELVDAGPHEDLFFLRESRLIGVLGEDLGGSLHLARSRNDLEATLFKLALKERLRGAIGAFAGVIDSMLTVAERERGTIIVAYTHGQPAQPTTLGHYLGAMIEIQLRHADRLLRAYADVDLCPLGAAAITTTGFRTDRDRLAELLGFAAVQENSYGCIAAVDYLTGTFSALKLALLDIGRLCQDLAFWCGFEVGQLRAPDGFVQISSIMPQKRNPLAIEHLRTMASLAAGQCQAVIDTVHNTPFADMVDAEAPTQQAGKAAFDMFARVTSLLEAFIAGITVNADNVRRNIDASCITMTELADSLVRVEGISFRTAHHIASRLSRLMIERSIGMSELTPALVSEVFHSVAGRAPAITPEQLASFISAEGFVAQRETFGGPGPAVLGAALVRYRAAWADVNENLARFETVERASLDRLEAAVSALSSN